MIVKTYGGKAGDPAELHHVKVSEQASRALGQHFQRAASATCDALIGAHTAKSAPAASSAAELRGQRVDVGVRSRSTCPPHVTRGTPAPSAAHLVGRRAPHVQRVGRAARRPRRIAGRAAARPTSRCPRSRSAAAHDVDRGEPLGHRRVRDAVAPGSRPAQLVAGADAGDEPVADHALQASSSVWTSTASGTQADPGHQRAEPDPRWSPAASAPSSVKHVQRRTVGLADRPEVVEHEHAVEPELLGPHAPSATARSASARELRQRGPDAHVTLLCLKPNSSGQRPRGAGSRALGNPRTGTNLHRQRATGDLAAFGTSFSSRQGGRAGRRRWRRPARPGRRHDVDRRAVLGRLDQVDERLADRVQQDRPGLDQPAAEHETLGVEDVGQVGQAEGHPPAERGPSRRCAPASPSAAAAVTCSPRTASGSPPASSTTSWDLAGVGRLPGQAAEAAARGVALPAAPLAARARQPVDGVDDHVADLAGEAVGAAHELAADHDAAADAGAERHQQHVRRGPRRRRACRSPHAAHVGVVVDVDRHAEPRPAARPRTASSVDAREVRRRTAARRRGRRGRARRRRPAHRSAACSCGRHLDDGVDERGARAACGVGTRCSATTSPCVVDDDAEALGAPDVDADGRASATTADVLRPAARRRCGHVRHRPATPPAPCRRTNAASGVGSFTSSSATSSTARSARRSSRARPSAGAPALPWPSRSRRSRRHPLSFGATN